MTLHSNGAANGALFGEATMSINGDYTIKVHTPAGDREVQLSLHSDGDHLTGQQCAEGHCQNIENGEIHDSHFSWSGELEDPRATLHFKAQCDDDVCSTISGDVEAEGLGTFHFTGRKG
jgi:hypothetical protein